jgi:hypothetical protein
MLTGWCGGGAENEITALNNISKKLQKLNSIDTNIKSLSSNISSVKDELKIMHWIWRKGSAVVIKIIFSLGYITVFYLFLVKH